jgi:ParB family transcriptional regulator, chromosome partitioning protein
MSNRRRGGLGRGLGALIGPPGVATVERSTEPDGLFDEDPEPIAPADGVTTVSAANQPNVDQPGVDQLDVDQPVEALVDVPGVYFTDLPVNAIRANPRQPRTVFDEETLAELTHSVREFGVLQPIVVRPAGGESYELVMGERRLRASIAAGLSHIPAIVRDTGDDVLLRDALLENIHRVQLNPLEEAAAYQQLLQEFGVSHDDLAGRLGRSRSHVSNTIRLLNLSVPVQRRVAAGVLSAGHARALLSLPNADDQDELAGRIVAEGMSVRATEEIVALAAARGGLAEGGRRRIRTRRFTAPAVADLADRLSDAFDTRVRVDIGRRKGRIVVEFATLADLERIVGVMAPEVEAHGVITDEVASQATGSAVADTSADPAFSGTAAPDSAATQPGFTATEWTPAAVG